MRRRGPHEPGQTARRERVAEREAQKALRRSRLYALASASAANPPMLTPTTCSSAGATFCARSSRDAAADEVGVHRRASLAAARRGPVDADGLPPRASSALQIRSVLRPAAKAWEDDATEEAVIAGKRGQRVRRIARRHARVNLVAHDRCAEQRGAAADEIGAVELRERAGARANEGGQHAISLSEVSAAFAASKTKIEL